MQGPSKYFTLAQKLEKKSSWNCKKYPVGFELNFFPVDQTQYFKLENCKNQWRIENRMNIS